MKSFLQLTPIMGLLMVLASGCAKTLDEPQSIKSEVSSDFRMHKHEDDCRLVREVSPFATQTYTYNTKGLLDQWYTDLYGGYFKHEYNKYNRLIKSRLYVDGVLIYTVAFFYNQRGKVYRELWYDGGTATIADDVIYYFGKDGLPRKLVSDIGGYSVKFNFDWKGNLTSYSVYVDDKIANRADYTYERPVKNVLRAIPGLDYQYAYLNGVYAYNRLYSTSEKVTSYDENGLATVIYDQDPRKTVIEANQARYPVHVGYYDRLSADVFTFDFTYDNCESCKKERHGFREGTLRSALRKTSSLLTKGRFFHRPAGF